MLNRKSSALIRIPNDISWINNIATVVRTKTTKWVFIFEIVIKSVVLVEPLPRTKIAKSLYVTTRGI
jgi:hypothetical protein